MIFQFKTKHEGIFDFYRKRAFIWYENIFCSTIFSQHHEQIQILNEYAKENDNFDIEWAYSREHRTS